MIPQITEHYFLYSIIFSLIVSLSSCEKEQRYYTETDRTISVTEKIKVDNGFLIHDEFNFNTFDNFLAHISSSDRFLLVQQKDFLAAKSKDKVIISLRYDIDENIDAALKFAYREHKYGIRSSYFVLHSAKYYGAVKSSTFSRNKNMIFYLKKMQNDFGQEIGFHNDLVTFQIVYNIPSREYLKSELEYLRSNNIEVSGTTYHGSEYCYRYQYFNAYFWYEFPRGSWNYDYVIKGLEIKKIEKDSLNNYDLKYEGGLLNPDYFFTDVDFINGKRWNMTMVNFDTIKPGRKVIVLLHPALWDL